MKKIFLVTFLLCLCAINAQSQTFADGPVWHITFIRVKSDKLTDYGKFLREHFIPINEEMKKQGLIEDYKYFSSPVNKPTDWNFGFAYLYKNYGDALDSDADRKKKTEAIHLKHYGSVEEERKLMAQYNQMYENLSSEVMRERIFTPQ